MANFDPLDTQVAGSTLGEIQPDLTGLQEQQALISQQIETQTAQFETLQADLATQFSDAQNVLDSYTSVALEGIAATGNVDTTASEQYRAALDEQITNIQNAYWAQVQTQAKQIDALVGQGAFAGNAYRAQQAYASSMQSLTSQALGQVAQVSLSSEQALANLSLAEQQQTLAERTQYMNMLGNAAGMAFDAAKVYTGTSLEILTGKTGSINSLLGMQASLAQNIAGFEFEAQKLYTQTQLDIFKTQTSYKQTQISAAAQEYAALQNKKAQEAASAANLMIAQLQSDTALQQQAMVTEGQLAMTQMQTEAQVAQQQIATEGQLASTQAQIAGRIEEAQLNWWE